MKIVCESCGAKYSIADEKVAGKVFKIRCKKCSAVIVVKGDQQSASAGAPQALDAGSEAVWHVVVGGDQQGPFAPRQIGELLAEGKIDWEAYVWREGMDGWQPAKDVPQLVSAVMAESESSEAAKPAASEPLFGASSDMGADPFASTDDGGLSGVIGQAAAASASPAGGGADLFADSRRGAFGGPSHDDDDPRMGAPGPRVGTEDAMTGQRNENSVLFSLSNLQALATGSGAAPASSSSKPGAAGEGSGLIDIRALASATQTVSSGASSSAPRNKVDDLLAVGSSGTAFSATSLAAPVAVEKRDSSRTMLYLMAAAIVLLGGALAYLMVRPAPQPTAQLTPATEPGTATGAITQTPVPAPAQPTAAPQAAEPAPTPSQPSQEPSQPAAAAVDEERGRDEDDERERGGRERRHRDRDRESKSDREAKSDKGDKSDKSDSVQAAAETEKPEKKPASSSGDKSLDDLLDTALSGKPKSGGAAPKPAENLPATPSREDVLAAMKGVTPKVQGCGGGQTGVAMAKVNVAGPTGKVTGVDVSGQFAGTPVGACVSKEVAKAKFSKFSQSTFSFSYPFKL